MLAKTWDEKTELGRAQARIAQLEEEIRSLRALTGFDRMAKLSAETGVTGLQLTVLTLLMTRGTLPREAFVQGMYGHRADGGPDEAQKILDIMIYRLRPKLEAFGVTIKTIWGHGYSISKEDQELLRNLAADRRND